MPGGISGGGLSGAQVQALIDAALVGKLKSILGAVTASDEAAVGTVPTASSRYAGPFTSNYNIGHNFFSASEGARQIVVPFNCVIRNLFVKTATAQDPDGDLNVTLRKNGASTTVTLVVPSSSAAGVFSDTTHSVSFAAGDLLSLRFDNLTESAASASIVSFTLEVEYSP